MTDPSDAFETRTSDISTLSPAISASSDTKISKIGFEQKGAKRRETWKISRRPDLEDQSAAIADDGELSEDRKDLGILDEVDGLDERSVVCLFSKTGRYEREKERVKKEIG